MNFKGFAELSIEEQLQGQRALSQFQRALKELDVQFIHAHSPEAKGRVERQFRTFQHRLVKELRLENTKTIDEPNRILQKYLPYFNKRFNPLGFPCKGKLPLNIRGKKCS